MSRLFFRWHAAALLFLAASGFAAAHFLDDGADGVKKGYDIRKSNLVPVYPKGYECSPLTSLYASWKDIDGGDRDEAHSGVDGGRLGEQILAPAPGTVRAVWEADWRWGKEGALLISHTAADLNLHGASPIYYTAYDHLKYDEVKHLKVGQKVLRGQPLAHVYRPGGHKKFLPEVHWEVWEVEADELNWKTNKYGGREWRNEQARLIDPLFMLGIHDPPQDGRSVRIVPFEPDANYSKFRGFTYIFNCRKS
jgi:murein DD-endopeptidase MepM/ murein hydrolase activator NlpD